MTTRALVVGTLDVTPAAEPSVLRQRAARLAADGADIVELVLAGDIDPAVTRRAVTQVGAALSPAPGERPFADRAPAVGVAVAVPDASRASAAVAAGAVLVSTREHATADLLGACAPAGTAVVVTAAGSGLADVRARLVECARQAEALGLPPDRIVVEPVLDRALVPHIRRFAELGYPLLLTVTGPVLERLGPGPGLPGAPPPPPVGLAAAVASMAVIGGCRLIRTDDVRATRRVCRVLAAILEAR